jgi:hypothetical protein
MYTHPVLTSVRIESCSNLVALWVISGYLKKCMYLSCMTSCFEICIYCWMFSVTMVLFCTTYPLNLFLLSYRNSVSFDQYLPISLSSNPNKYHFIVCFCELKFLDSTYEWDNVVFIFLHLGYLTECNNSSSNHAVINDGISLLKAE